MTAKLPTLATCNPSGKSKGLKHASDLIEEFFGGIMYGERWEGPWIYSIYILYS